MELILATDPCSTHCKYLALAIPISGLSKQFLSWWNYTKKKLKIKNRKRCGFGDFQSPGQRRKENFNNQICTFGFDRVTNNINRWLKIYILFLVYNQIWLVLLMENRCTKKFLRRLKLCRIYWTMHARHGNHMQCISFWIWCLVLTFDVINAIWWCTIATIEHNNIWTSFCNSRNIDFWWLVICCVLESLLDVCMILFCFPLTTKQCK